MQSLTCQEIRRRFIDYFKKHSHTHAPSSPVIPHDDPTLLFINAGMNQFKDVFLGKTVRDYSRATTSQKCIRAGGKHNDLENVGHTKRHLTFFEMLGNFSFGDYFKEEAIKWSWELSTEILQFPEEKLWPTVFRDDDEAFEMWTKYVPAERITRFDEADNFWAMGDTGPCGPCSELFYDRGDAFGPAANPSQDTDGERYLEFWNLVFMQYNRDASGVMTPLPKQSVDTGSGLERVASLLQDKENVFETDILRHIISAVERRLGKKYDPQGAAAEAPAFRVIADHLRSLSFAIADGAQPSNVDRGYVLRKILRRAVRYGRQLADVNEPFLADLLPALIEKMGDDYPELVTSKSRIQDILSTEEEGFQRVLNRGKNMLSTIITNAHESRGQITGDDAFKLKDTYGFPLDEILLIAKDADLNVDTHRFGELEDEARDRSRSAHKATHQLADDNLFAHYAEEQGTTEFDGYTQHALLATVKGIIVDGNFSETLTPGQEGLVLLDKTPFYPEMGGQVGDTGEIRTGDSVFEVSDTQAPFKGVTAHSGIAKSGSLNVGDTITAEVDVNRRHAIANNHTATHLLHWALQKVLGDQIKQAGSVVSAHRLRFDFNHHKAVSEEEIRQIEDMVNAKIRGNQDVRSYEIDYAEAQGRSDIKQFFGDKYDSRVRVVDIDYSKELCGGTHTSAVGNIGYFRVAKESSIAAGVRRIEAVTGADAEAIARDSDDTLSRFAADLKVPIGKLSDRLAKLIEENKSLKAELQNASKAKMGSLVGDLMKKVETVDGFSFLAAALDVGMKELRGFADQAMDRLGSGILVLGAGDGNRCQLIVRVSDDTIEKGYGAQAIIKEIAPIVDGKGGGKPDSAQAGGAAPDKLAEAIAKAAEIVKAAK